MIGYPQISETLPTDFPQKNKLYPRSIHMKNLLKLEELFMFGLALFLFSKLDYGWGWYALWFFAPDLPAKNAGMI